MNLDHRAARAARGIKSGVAGAPIPAPPGAAAPAPTPIAGAPWMRAVTAAAAVVVVGVIVAMVGSPGVFAPSVDDGDPAPVIADTTTTTEAKATTTTEAPKPTTTEAPKAAANEAPKPTTTEQPKEEPPSYTIVITDPKEGLETDAKGVNLRAEVSDGMEIQMHGVTIEPVNGVAEGYILLEPGWNELWVKGYADGAKVAYDTVKVYRVADEKPAEEKPAEKPAEEKPAEKPAYAVEITSPAPGTVTENEWILVKGVATPGVGELEVHGKGVAVAADGTWAAEVWLGGGKTEVWAKLYVGGQKVAYDTVLVERAVPQTVPFTANQQYGSCSETPPWDVFYGTATPGHEIKVWTDYGYEAVVVGESGQWEIRYTFPSDLPLDKAVPVKVWNYTTGEKIYFEFVHTSS